MSIQYPPRRPLVILGPTAGGKSEFAVALAQALHQRGEALPHILGADSMQVYRHMDAGTAKPSASLREQVPHHMIDLVEPTQRFTAYDWLTLAETKLAELAGNGTRAIIVGGTNLYLKALLEGMFTGSGVESNSPDDQGTSPTSTSGAGHDPQLRAELEPLDNQSLHDRLAQVDPASANRIHRNDRKRIIRALEVFTHTGKPISSLQTQWDEHYQFTKNTDTQPASSPGSPAVTGYRHNPILVGLHWPTEIINQRINLRVRQMFYPEKVGLKDESLPAETERLEQAKLLGPQARLALGYQQVLDHLAGHCSMEDAFEKTKIGTRRYARQQRTWLKRYQGVLWLPAHELPLEAWVHKTLEVIPLDNHIADENPKL